jgi:hypothetical protein
MRGEPGRYRACLYRLKLLELAFRRRATPQHASAWSRLVPKKVFSRAMFYYPLLSKGCTVQGAQLLLQLNSCTISFNTAVFTGLLK